MNYFTTEQQKNLTIYRPKVENAFAAQPRKKNSLQSSSSQKNLALRPSSGLKKNNSPRENANSTKSSPLKRNSIQKEAQHEKEIKEKENFVLIEENLALRERQEKLNLEMARKQEKLVLLTKQLKNNSSPKIQKLDLSEESANSKINELVTRAELLESSLFAAEQLSTNKSLQLSALHSALSKLQEDLSKLKQQNLEDESTIKDLSKQLKS